MPITSYQAQYYAYELNRRYSANSIEKLTASLSNAQVDLNPHQVDAALFAFKSPLSKGAILADEVGLGKTIEAGIVIAQKWAERKRKILVVLPANLRKQWSQELADKFFLPSLIVEKKSFDAEIQRGNFNPFDQQENIVLCSYQFVRSKAIYVSKIEWDLVVIDEAHRLRNVYKASNRIANTIKEALRHAPKVLLTATPLQNSLLELFGLVSIVDEYTFGDLMSFREQYVRQSDTQVFEELKARLAPVCKRTLRRQVLEYIKYTKRTCLVQEFVPNDDEQKLYDMVSEYLQDDNLYALPPSQRQLMTLILRKLLASSTYAITGTFQGLANRLSDILAAQPTESDTALENTFANDYETYYEQRDEWVDDEEEDEKKGKETRIYSPEEQAEIRREIERLEAFQRLAASVRNNAKGEVLVTALERGFEKLHELGANRKAIIFTESTRTQNYLKTLLESRGFADEIVLFNGSNSDPLSNRIYQDWLKKHKGTDTITGSRTADKRAALVEYFRDQATIMIATEAAAEGINLQFCSLVVNYDLPWNPQRIEQRIGRCHRYGQKFDVVVVNFLNNKNAADQRVYQLLAEKFQLFDGVFGASDEVLGAIESGVDFEKRILAIYQGCRKPEEIQAAFDALQQEMSRGIEADMMRTRKNLLENFDEEVTEKLRINQRESMESLDKFEQRLWEVTQYALADSAHFNEAETSFLLHTNPFPAAEIHPGPYRLARKHAGADAAPVDTEVNIFRIGHPLAQQILARCCDEPLPARKLVFDLTNSGKNIAILNDLRGKRGWLQLVQLTIQALETEDHLLFAAAADGGSALDSAQCQRMFALPARVLPMDARTLALPRPAFDMLFKHQEEALVQDSNLRNNQLFDEENQKLEKWSEDRRNSLHAELRAISADIKLKKNEARKAAYLEAKIALQRAVKDLERQLAEKRNELYQSEDEIDRQKEEFLNRIEARLKRNISRKELFTIYWEIV